MKCTACGGELGALDPSCRYCGAPTPYGQHQSVQAQQWQLHEQHRTAHEQAIREHGKREESARSLHRTANAALLWGIGGLVGCCAFVPSIVAIVLGLRARKLAQKYDLVIPTNATLGLALGVLGCLLGAGMLTFIFIEEQRREAEIARIEAKLEGRLSASTLDHDAACLLAQRSLLKGEFRGSNNVSSFTCDGKLNQSGESAELEDVCFLQSSTHQTLRVCLKKGARWFVAGFRKEGGCHEPDDTGSSQGFASAAASSSSSAASSSP